MARIAMRALCLTGRALGSGQGIRGVYGGQAADGSPAWNRREGQPTLFRIWGCAAAVAQHVGVKTDESAKRQGRSRNQ
jgi:hypothetical protein